MRVRQTETFSAITDKLMLDLSTVYDALMQFPKKKPRNGREDNERYKGNKGNGRGGGDKGKGKGNRATPT